MKEFFGFYNNGRYKVGMNGTVWVYDMDDRLVGRFRETPYSYEGAFVPGTDIFVSRTNECHLVVYDLPEMRIVRKIKTSNTGSAENAGYAFSNDGKRFYCIQAHPNDSLARRLVAYDTESFDVIGEWFADRDDIVLSEIEIEDDATCYVLGYERRENNNDHFVGIFRDGEIMDKRSYACYEFTATMYFAWKRHGFTRKSYQWTFGGLGIGLQIEGNPKQGSLKRLYETGRL